jgi:hypothetical protein
MNLNSKDILARLLATENVTVTHKNAQTASFNVRDRVLTLPMWDDMDSNTYDHLVGHEVGHALYTPEDGWHDAVCSKGQAYKSFLNVVEDARIEKMIQARYPGLRRSFISSYKKMLSEGFFGGDIETINTFDLIDRINTYFKAGRSAGIRIDRDEMIWVNEIENLETWEDVVDVTDRLFSFCKKKKDEELEQLEDFMSSPENQEEEEEDEDSEYDAFDHEDDYDDEDSDSNSTDVEQASQQDESESVGSEEADEDEEPMNASDMSSSPEEKDEMISKTDKMLRKNIANEHGDNGDCTFRTIDISNAPINGRIISYKTIINDYMTPKTPEGERCYMSGEIRMGLRIGQKMYRKFLLENKKTVNYMVKEFEMKKSAAAYSRQSTSKTGVIDPVKMNSYLYNDDIFRKVSVTMDGKDHGMIMYMDWSGSMADDLNATISQLLNLVLFCKQVSIPFRVYAFTDRGNDISECDPSSNLNTNMNTTGYYEGFRLLEMFNSEMNRSDFNKMSEIWLALSKCYSSHRSWTPPNDLMLGGTPLDECIVAALQIHDEFKAKTNVDIVNTIFLTDGESHPVLARTHEDERGWHTRINNLYDNSGRRVLYLNDPVTKKRYRVSGYRDMGTATLLKIYRERTKSVTVGYRIMSPSWGSFKYQLPSSVSWSMGTDLCKKMRADRFVVLPPVLGYDRCFAIAGGRFLATSNGEIEVDSDASKAKIRTAFKKANNSRKGSRKLLSDLIETIS